MVSGLFLYFFDHPPIFYHVSNQPKGEKKIRRIFMKKQIQQKIKLGLPLTKKEKALYLIYSKKIDIEIVKN